MSSFVQLHILTSYPASNLNRDDMGAPKTVVMGNTKRLRISSQSLKRAWRTSEVFRRELAGGIGIRTKEMGEAVYHALILGRSLEEVLDNVRTNGPLAVLKEKKARDAAKAVAGVFGKPKSAKEAAKEAEQEEEGGETAAMRELHIEQLAHFGPSEIKAISALVEACRESGKVPEGEALDLLRKNTRAADIALFGRMLADEKLFNVDAACQVSHPMTVHAVKVESDFFTAVDDLNKDEPGAAHMGVFEFGAGLFYLYVCVDKDLLKANLDGDGELTARTLKALCMAACTVSPTGKQNSFASRAWASFCLAEKGDVQPRTLAGAFLDAVGDKAGLLDSSIKVLRETRANFEKVYGLETESQSFYAEKGEGSLEEICDFISGE